MIPLANPDLYTQPIILLACNSRQSFDSEGLMSYESSRIRKLSILFLE
jgi:hypothetical protein